MEENIKSKEANPTKNMESTSDSNLETAKLELAEHMRSYENEVEYSDKKDKNLSDMDGDKVGKWCNERLNILFLAFLLLSLYFFDF